MPLLWVALALIALIGLVAVASATVRANDEARGLRRDIGRFADLQPALVELRDATEGLRDAARALRQR